ncbi:Protein lifeguard 4 [Armadillidium nasatum]|uniref:Protein lifeguard 4 n=1 Tax=Armadillidium nasatum TaxID=96803 RepID=A0A5N5TLE7_9CRUS|nr:Protein lifeguard 4 [Armadillidium nasatum]
MSTEHLLPNEGDPEEGGMPSEFMRKKAVASFNIKIRMGFQRKVYSLLSVQLLLTTIVAGFCAYSEVLNSYLKDNPVIFFLCLPLSIVLFGALYIKRLDVPANFYLLVAYTIVEAVTVGVFVSLYDVASVIQALILTTIIVVSLTIYTLQSKRDFSNLGTGLMIGLILLFGMGITNLFFSSTGMELIISGGGAILFSLFIVYDTHMMMKKLPAEEYILATINLYLDVISLFLKLLKLIGVVELGRTPWNNMVELLGNITVDLVRII